jgi:hypothetical protein
MVEESQPRGFEPLTGGLEIRACSDRKSILEIDLADDRIKAGRKARSALPDTQRLGEVFAKVHALVSRV